LAVYTTRFVSAYELLDAGWAVPVTAGLGVAAIVLARRSRARRAVSLRGASRSRVARAGRILGLIGLCLAAAALVSLGVYGLLEYVGSRG
jgi:hypothetical protein